MTDGSENAFPDLPPTLCYELKGKFLQAACQQWWFKGHGVTINTFSIY